MCFMQFKCILFAVDPSEPTSPQKTMKFSPGKISERKALFHSNLLDLVKKHHDVCHIIMFNNDMLNNMLHECVNSNFLMFVFLA